MTTATQTPKCTKPQKRGFPGLCCLNCGEEDSIRINAADMLAVCPECDAEFTADDIREKMAAWARLADWLDSAPVVEE